MSANIHDADDPFVAGACIISHEFNFSLATALDAPRVVAQVGEIVVALPPGSLALELRGTLQTPLHVVEGGATRQDSVARGFAATAEQAEFVVVHDAARPLCPVSLVERTLEAAAVHGAAIAALAAHDTVKQRAAGDPHELRGCELGRRVASDAGTARLQHVGGL